jgi:hypothetical protein
MWVNVQSNLLRMIASKACTNLIHPTPTPSTSPGPQKMKKKLDSVVSTHRGSETKKNCTAGNIF